MMIRNLVAVSRITLCAAGLLYISLATGQPAQAASNEGVVLTGFNVQFGDNAAAISDSALSRSQLCGAEGSASMLNLVNHVADRIEGRLARGEISQAERQREVEAARSELCQIQDPFSVDAYAMTYANCRLTMDTASILTDISLPPGGSSASMSINDFNRAESNRMSLDRTVDASSGMGTWTGDVNWTGPGDNKRVAGYPTTRWDFQFEGGVGFGESTAGLEALGLNATFSNTGYGYYSTSAPGNKIAQAFFDKFASQIQAGQNSSMFAGLLNTMVDMLQKGMPLEMEQTVSTNMAGMSRGGMRSKMKATGLRQVTLSGDYCTSSLVPDHFAVTNLDQQFEAEGAELNQAMGELNKAMEQMTPEQREALQGLGLGSMFGGQANPAGQPAETQAPAGGASAAGAMPTSADLTTDDMTQSVQLHLDALGYDTGNTNGELSTATVIAISQFQAEKGMEVTGEVTPQLLGILGAEVDAR